MDRFFVFLVQQFLVFLLVKKIQLSASLSKILSTPFLYSYQLLFWLLNVHTCQCNCNYLRVHVSLKIIKSSLNYEHSLRLIFRRQPFACTTPSRAASTNKSQYHLLKKTNNHHLEHRAVQQRINTHGNSTSTSTRNHCHQTLHRFLRCWLVSENMFNNCFTRGGAALHAINCEKIEIRKASCYYNLHKVLCDKRKEPRYIILW